MIPLGDNNTRTLKPGVQTLTGELALAYARVRKAEGDDFGRAQRQQQVIMAIRNQLIRPRMLPELIAKAPILYNELSSGIKTNLTLEQVIKLAWMAQQIEEEDIKKGVIAPPDMVLLSKSSEGDDVLKPIMDKIRALRDSVFFSKEKASPAAVNMSPVELVQAEAPRLSVLNGTAEAGMAARTTEYLQSQGIQVCQYRQRRPALHQYHHHRLYRQAVHAALPGGYDEDLAQPYLQPLRPRQPGGRGPDPRPGLGEPAIPCHKNTCHVSHTSAR